MRPETLEKYAQALRTTVAVLVGESGQDEYLEYLPVVETAKMMGITALELDALIRQTPRKSESTHSAYAPFLARAQAMGFSPGELLALLELVAGVRSRREQFTQ